MDVEQKAGLPVLSFEDQAAWEAWLSLHHADNIGIWLKTAKKGAPVQTVSYELAVESALCFGWIDSQIARFDNQYYLHKFSPRKPNSKWSQVNREKAEKLISTGRMRPAGLAQVELAKANGAWEAAYDPQSRIAVPEDLQSVLDQHRAAKDFFEQLDSRNRYAILYRIQDARKPATRLRRINKFVKMLDNKEKFYP